MDNEEINLAVDLEYYQTPQWAIDAIIEKEHFDDVVVDPCAGDFRMAVAIDAAGHDVYGSDIHNWTQEQESEATSTDFLSPDHKLSLPS